MAMKNDVIAAIASQVARRSRSAAGERGRGTDGEVEGKKLPYQIERRSQRRRAAAEGASSIIKSVLARRSAWGVEENRLARMARQRRAAGDLCDLTVSNPTRCGFIYPPIELEERSEYRPEPLGLPSAREAIAAYYAERGVAVSPEQIVVTASTSEAYSHLF